MSTAIDLIASVLPDVTLPEIPKRGICCVTGLECNTISRHHVILDSFTSVDLLRSPQSDRAGVNAFKVLQYTVTHPTPEKKRDLRPLQQSSWVCTDKSLTLLNRVGVRDHVLNGVEASRWCGYATTSYKKHGALRTPVNSGRSQIWLFETTLVDCSDRQKVLKMWQRMRDAQDNGISRPLIESLDISPGYIIKLGWRRWIEFERWASPIIQSPLYRFIAYLLPSIAELKGETDEDQDNGSE